MQIINGDSLTLGHMLKICIYIYKKPIILSTLNLRKMRGSNEN